MPLTTFSPGGTISSAAVNANFALCVLTDTARVITALHDFTHASGLKTDTISESTLNAGVTIDGCLIKDGGAAGIRETSGPTVMTVGAVGDGEILRREGTTLIGAAAFSPILNSLFS